MRVWVLVVWVWAVGLAAAVTSEWSYGATVVLANLNVTYKDPHTGTLRTDESGLGKYGSGTVGAAAGVLRLARTTDAAPGRYSRHGCVASWSVDPPGEPWMALVARGQCSDRSKVENALAHNASAVLVYTKDARAHLQKIVFNSFRRDFGDSVVVVFIGHGEGEQLARLLENGTRVHVAITQGNHVRYHITNINRTSVLFVSVSFIILMVISLAWLIFYYVQRFRYIHAKDKLARHLCNAAKKALAKIPVKNLKSGDRELGGDGECCAVCIEPYQVAEAVRILPCKHEFHKGCVDPWLLEHRTCPMCKMDILKFYGYILSESQESVLEGEVEDASASREVRDSASASPMPPAPTTRSSHISEVAVVPRAEVAAAAAGACEDWSGCLVPNTPISPVHQLPPAATPSTLLSIISSAKSRSSSSSKSSCSSQVAAVCTSLVAPAAAPQSGAEEEEVSEEGCTAVRVRPDVELSSVHSDDFSDGASTQSASLDTSTTTPPDIGLHYGANTTSVVAPEPITAPLCASLPSLTAAVPVTPQYKSSSAADVQAQKEPSSRRSSSRMRSLSRRRSLSRSRSRARRRSSSSCRTPASQGHTQEGQLCPSSHVVSVSHL